MKKLFALILALLLLLPAAVACTDAGDPEESAPPSQSESNTESAEDTQPAVEELIIATAGTVTEYKVIYGDDTEKDTVTLIQSVVKEINTTYAGALMFESKAYADWEDAPEGTLEILIGNTNRPETEELKKDLDGLYQYAIKAFENGRIAIVATNDRTLKTAVRYFHSTFIKKDTDGVLSVPKDLYHFVDESLSEEREDWQLSVPTYTGGTLSTGLYNIGPGATITSNSALGRMQLIAGTNRTEFDAYVAKLEQSGYTQIAKAEMLDNVFVQYENTVKKKLVYAYLWEDLGEVRVIEEKQSIKETAFEYDCSSLDNETVVYQYAMMYNRNGHGNQIGDPYGNNGMFYIVKLADNKLVLVDGGSTLQATEGATAELMKFLREITGKSASEKVDIACYIISHAHGDHKQFVQNLVTNYASEINLERVMHNLPNWDYGAFTALATTMKQNFPNAQYIKPHTGQMIRMGSMDMEIITTHEDIVDPDTGKSRIIDFNSSSMVVRFHINGKTVMMNGDWGGGDTRAPADYAETEARLLQVYTDDTTGECLLKSDVVQVAHHALNPYMSKYVAAVAATYAFFPAADVKMAKQAHEVVRTNYYQFIEAGGDADKVYFSSRYTYCLAIAKNGTVTVAATAIRGADTGDNPQTSAVEQDYVNVTLKVYEAYRTPTAAELAAWETIHS